MMTESDRNLFCGRGSRAANVLAAVPITVVSSQVKAPFFLEGPSPEHLFSVLYTQENPRQNRHSVGKYPTKIRHRRKIYGISTNTRRSGGILADLGMSTAATTFKRAHYAYFRRSGHVFEPSRNTLCGSACQYL